ncbi:antitoxin Xre/MbcA/ParS toxin-binding domain-containing protein, partial [Phenylobacterium sp.]|uniref:antitoxin Xre/MbcA/ParS toxin-binding domain-containing protein n=1 Tax=Phenylobacterium sp. TaxID=1871053 RepID=UPI003982F8AD
MAEVPKKAAIPVGHQQVRKVARSRLSGRFSIASLMNERGAVKVDDVADAFSMSKAQLAETAGLAREVFQKASRRDGPKAQTRVREMLEIISLVQAWAGGPAQAMAWYRAEQIPAFGGRTAEALVKSGKAGAVRDYVDHLAAGGYA